MRDEDQPLSGAEAKFVAITSWWTWSPGPAVPGVQVLGFSLHDRDPSEVPWHSGEEWSTLEES